MKLHTLKKTIAASAFGLIALLGTSGIANAQNNRQVQRQQQKIVKQQQKVIKQQQKLSIQQQRAEMQRQQQEQLRLEQQRQEQIRQQNMRNNQYGNVYSTNNNRYRVYRNGGYYQTDNRGAELLRQAVNAGYQQGVQAGRTDRANRRTSNWSNSSIYRSGTYGYQSYVDRSQYQYYFQQGFERGYQDGYNSRYQYGSSNSGGFNILGSILQGILNIQQF